MVAKIEYRKCKECGHEFIKTIGGFILKENPISIKCPRCGSSKTKKIE